jgi:hypothetical protein
VTVNIGGTGGTCSISGSMGSYTFSSTSTVTVTAQSTDDTTKAGTFNFNVCANLSGTLANSTSGIVVMPAYQQAYQSQVVTLQSYVTGCVDETGVWSITTKPSGGNATLTDTTYRDAQFNAGTVTGRYVLTDTSNCNGGTGTAIVYVSPNSMPSYLVTPNGTRPHECYPDPALTGTDYEIGSGKAYSTIGSTTAIGSVTAGSIYRLWNTDTTGLSPSTYAEYFQIQKSGTATQPIIFCGVPDSLGNLPVMTGTNATGQSSINNNNGTAGYGLISIWPSSHYGYWKSGAAGPSYVSVTGISFQNANPSNTYTQPGGVSGTCPSGGTSTTCAWLSFTAGINARSGTYVDISGNETNGTTLGVFSDDNTSNAWATYTQAFSLIGNNFHNCGWTNTGAHCLYLQTLYTLVEGNKIGPGGSNYYLSGDGPSGLKFRGAELIARYNLIGANLDRDFDFVDNSDGSPYVTMDVYLGAPGNVTCAQSLYCLGDTAGGGIIAAYFESEQKDFVYGNIAGWSDGGQVHYGADVTTGIQDRNGVFYFYDNTMWQAQDLFDNQNSAGKSSILGQRIDARNNIFWPYTGGTIPDFTRFVDLTFSGTTNLLETSSISITTPITGGIGGTAGWANGGSTPYCSDGSPCDWPLTNPMNTHLPGLGSGNYLFTGTQPFASGTFIPPTGSAAISAGTALTGLPAQLPVRWQWNVSGGYLIPRANSLTIGAEDQAGTSGPGAPQGLQGKAIPGGSVN